MVKIGELGRSTGLNPKTIRFYEQQGLLPEPDRTSSGYRQYDSRDIERLDFIRKAKQLGLSLEDIKGILQLYEREEATCLHVRSLLDEKLKQIDGVLNDLQKFRSEIVSLRESAGDLMDCRPSGGRICGIIEGADMEAHSWPLSWSDARPERG